VCNTSEGSKRNRDLQAFAPRCPKCDGPTTLAMLLPGQHGGDQHDGDLVTYRCEECNNLTSRTLPR